MLEVGANVDFMPYEFYWTNPDTGEEELAGFDMALAKGIADKLGVKLELKDQAFAGLVTALAQGEAEISVFTHNSKSAKLTLSVVDPLFPTKVKLTNAPESISASGASSSKYRGIYS